MKALVLAGGSGSRLRPFTYSMPKQLMPVANKPVIEYAIDDLKAAGVTDLCIVVGAWGESVSQAVGDGSRHGVTVTYTRQDRPRGLAHAVQSARPFLGDDDFVMYLGDNVLGDGIAPTVEEFRRLRPAAGLVVQEVTDPRAYGVADVAPDGRVRRLEEKPEQPRSNLAVVGVYYFTSAIHQAVDSVTSSARGELEITDAIELLVSQGHDVLARTYHGFWKDVGRVDDVLACNRHLMRSLRPALDGQVDAASELRGPVVVEPGARVVRSRITGPAVIGAGTLVEDCSIGPGTAIGRDCRLRGATIADSIVLQGAQVCAPCDLHGSLVGRFATVGPGVPGDPGHRLVLGDHAHVEITAA